MLQRSTELLAEFCAYSSASGEGSGIANFAGRLAREFEQRGLPARVESEVAADGGRLPVLIAGRSDPTAAPLLLLSHLDTVLPARPPRIEGDFLHASGALDTKGGLVALLGALDLLARRGLRPPADLLLVAVPDEETSGEIAHRRTRAHGDTARALWVLEPGEPRENGAETMVAGRRGLFHWRANWTGRAAHSGLHYWSGRSALTGAAEFAVDAAGLSRPRGGPTVNVARLVAGDQEFVDGLVNHHRWLGTAKQINVVPDRARVEGEARFLVPQDRVEVERDLRALAASVAQRRELTAEFWCGGAVPPVDPHGPHRDAVDAAQRFAAAAGWSLQIEDDRGGISFPNFLANPGGLPILDGLGPVGSGMHTLEEAVSITSLGRRIRLLADLLGAEVGGAAGGAASRTGAP